eukprot:gene1550-2081_t
MWDTAGPERFRTISSAYYRGAHVILLLVDVTVEPASAFYSTVDNYLEQIQLHGQEFVMVFVVGTKIDLENARQISFEDARDFVWGKGYQYFEVSSKTAVGVHELIHHAVKSRLMTALQSGTLKPRTTTATNTGPPPLPSFLRSSWRKCSLS